MQVSGMIAGAELLDVVGLRLRHAGWYTCLTCLPQLAMSRRLVEIHPFFVPSLSPFPSLVVLSSRRPLA